MLTIHLRGNDLTRLSGKALIINVICDLTWLRATYPAMHIVWSTIIPQLVWRDVRIVLPINTARRNVNRDVCRAVCSGLELVIGHHRIRVDMPEFSQMAYIYPNEVWMSSCKTSRGGVSCWSLVSSMAGMGLNLASPYVVAGSAE